MLVFTLYLALSLSSILYFGADNVMPSIFDNFSQATDWQSHAILAMFLLVLLCNAPFPFFAGKTALVAGISILVTLQTKPVNDDDFFRDRATDAFDSPQKPMNDPKGSKGSCL
jgi:Na+/proline symporter